MNKDQAILKTFVEEIFVNEQDSVSNILKAYGLENSILQIIKRVNDPAYFSELDNPDFIKSLSSSFIVRVNSRIEEISNAFEKKEVEYVIGQISEHLLIKLIHTSSLETSVVLNQISKGLKTSCELNGWDYHQLNRMVKFELLHGIAAKYENGTTTTDTIRVVKNQSHCYYCWKGNPKDLEDLAFSLKDKKVVKSKVDFTKLFENHENDISVKVYEDKLEYLIVLFDQLNHLKLISVKGGRVGHFTPIRRYTIDLSGEVLIKRNPKHIKYGIMKDQQKAHSLVQDVQNLLSPYLTS